MSPQVLSLGCLLCSATTMTLFGGTFLGFLNPSHDFFLRYVQLSRCFHLFVQNINVFGSRDVALRWSLVEEKLSCGNNAQVLKK